MRELLFREPYRFGFFQAVRLLERIYPNREPVGEAAIPAKEVVRFRNRVSLEFPASQVHDLIRRESEDGASPPPEMIVNFLGMIGPQGVLPASYTELILERVRYKDTVLRDFLDMFTHRMVSHFYGAWEKYRFPIAYERGHEDRFTEYLFDLIGLGTKGLRGRMAVPDQALLLYAGMIAQKPHSADSIGSILTDYFGVPVRVESFQGQWLELEKVNLTRIGAANSQLGKNMIAGDRVWIRQSKFRLRFGPLRLKQFMGFLPRSPGAKAAAQLARFLVGLELDFDMQLVLAAPDVPGVQLGGKAAIPPMLGWTSWLTSAPYPKDADNVVIEVDV